MLTGYTKYASRILPKDAHLLADQCASLDQFMRIFQETHAHLLTDPPAFSGENIREYGIFAEP